MKFQWYNNGNQFEISMKYQWKSIGNWVAILMKYQWKSIGNPVKIHFEIKLEIEIGNSIGNSNGYLKFDRNNNEITNKNPAVNTFEISMTCQWKSIGKLVEIIMKDKLKFQWNTNGNPLCIQLKFQFNSSPVVI